MRMTTRRSMVFRAPVVLAGLLMAASFLLVSGCGTLSRANRETKTLYKGLPGSTDTYRKIMVILPFGNSAQWAAVDLNASFVPALTNAIASETDGVHIILPGSSEFPARFNEPARLADGNLDSAALAAAGQAAGVNLVLSGRLVGIRHIIEDRGMLWFARVVNLARVQMEIAVYHTGTGAKVLDRTVFQDIEISEAEGGRIDAQEMPEGVAMPQALNDIAQTMGKAVGNALEYIPWEGYVSRVEGDRIVLSAGESCGLKKGRVLKVFSVEKVTGGNDGQVFFARGNEVGKITVTAVYPDRTEAVIKDGGPIRPGSAVRAH